MSARDSVTDPWLTIIMPSFCGESWINFALDSIVTEGMDGIDVLIIDSSPTSATRDIAQTYQTKLRLRVLDRPDLRSWHHKTNVGVAMAESSHVCWLHVDDLWLPGRAKAVRQWIDRAPDADLHLCPTAIIDRNGRTLGTWRCPLPFECELPRELIMDRLVVQNFIGAPAPVFRKDAWEASGGLDESLWYTADWDLWLKLAAGGSVRYHNDPTVAFRIHGGSLTVTGSRDIADFTRQMQIVMDRYLPSTSQPMHVARAAQASITVNTALAYAASGNFRNLPQAISAVLKLGPAGIGRYLRDSRISERLIPRIRARLLGDF